MRISIITVSYNSAATIQDTLQCICDQQYKNVEHIVIDGSSTDHTISIVNQFPHISRLVCEPDNGLYDAMNKGLQMATGDIIGILNSDDIYADANVLDKVAAAFVDTNIDCLYGDLQYVHAHNMQKVLRHWRAGKFYKQNFLYGWMPPHPTFFARKKVYDDVGGFNTELKSAADYEIMLRILYKHGYAAGYIPSVLVKMRSGGVSNASLRNRFKANREDAKAWRLINKRPHFFTLYLKPLRKLPQYLMK
ncbi:MAG: glycosyltransferase family 2 protein [Chitinophagaceae bacterium]